MKSPPAMMKIGINSVCKNTVLVLLLMAALSAWTLYFGMMGFASQDGRNIKPYFRVLATPAKIKPAIQAANTTAKENALVTKQVKVKKLTTRDHIRHFVKKYTPKYPRFGFNFLPFFKNRIVNRTWSRNASRTETFRKEILAALGYMSAKRTFYLTKKNTAVGTKLHFYQNGDPVMMSQDFWESLPNKTIFEPIERFRRCSIVGSSGLLVGSGCGKEIDKADFVIRFNLAPVRNYENDVGTKTNFTTVNPSIIKDTMKSLKGEKNLEAFEALQRQFQGGMLWIPGFSQRGYYNFALLIAKVSAASGIMKPVVQHPGHYAAVLRLWRLLHRRSDWPSTGLYVVSSAFELCDEIEVFGFWYYPRSLEDIPVKYHYHNNVTTSARHSPLKEFQDLVKFHEMGIIKMHFGRCN